MVGAARLDIKLDGRELEDEEFRQFREGRSLWPQVLRPARKRTNR